MTEPIEPLQDTSSDLKIQEHVSIYCGEPIQGDQTENVQTSAGDIQCRICFEGDDCSKLSGKLINPCKCKGSIQYIHEECLKKQIISSSKLDQKTFQCELCLQKYLMEIKVYDVTSLRNIPQGGIKGYLLVILLTMLLVILIYAIYLVLGNIISLIYHNQKLRDNTQLRIQASVVAWLWILIALIGASLAAVVKNLMTITHVKWDIFTNGEHPTEYSFETKLPETFDDNDEWSDLSEANENSDL